MVRTRFMSTAIGAITIATALFPAFAAAANVAVNTQVLIPQGSTACPSPTISGVTPYVYNNALDSFDITVSDSSYVSILGSAGETGIPLRFMTRQQNTDGSLKIHVDLQSVPINGTLNISLTMLSSPAGKPTCITVVNFPVAGAVRPATTHMTTPSGTARPPSTSTATSAPSTSSSVTAASSALPVVGGGVQNALSRLCTAAGPYQLWFILLALFMVGVGLVAFAEPPLARKGTELPAALILVPLVLLLLFWYVTPACRVAVWIPVVLLIAAAVALIAAYREKAPIGKLMQLSPAKPLQPMAQAKAPVPMKQVQTTTIITPARAQQTTTTVTPNRVEQTKTIITPAPKTVQQNPPQKK